MRSLIAGLLLAVSLPLAAQSAKTAPTKKKPDSSAKVATPAATASATPAAAAKDPWVGSSKGKTYYRTGCAGASKLAAAGLVYFKTEDDAKKAGYKHSTQKSC